jgi:hypothetical protein
MSFLHRNFSGALRIEVLGAVHHTIVPGRSEEIIPKYRDRSKFAGYLAAGAQETETGEQIKYYSREPATQAATVQNHNLTDRYFH